MKGSDLRIGNLLMGGRGPVQITKIFSEDKVGLGGGDPYTLGVCLSEIPLDEEWLIKFGFEKYDRESNDEYIDFYGDCIYHFVKDGEAYGYIQDELNETGIFNLWIGANYGEETSIFRNGINLKHVHQLQNIHFALTGIELTIKA